LPRKKSTFAVVTSTPLMEDATIDILIEAEQRQWNHGMIDGFFAT